jgi:hypothetical protein
MQKTKQNPSKTWRNYGKLKRKATYFTPGLKQVVRFLEDDEQMTMIRDENGDDSVSASICSQSECQNKPKAKLTAWLLIRTVTEESKAENRCSWVLLDRPLPTRPGRKVIRSDCPSFPYPITFWGGGLPTEGGGGSQVQKISRILTVNRT